VHAENVFCGSLAGTTPNFTSDDPKAGAKCLLNPETSNATTAEFSAFTCILSFAPLFSPGDVDQSIEPCDQSYGSRNSRAGKFLARHRGIALLHESIVAGCHRWETMPRSAPTFRI